MRFPHWRVSLLMGVFELASALLIFLPHPLIYMATVEYCLGAGMLMSGIGRS